MKHQILHNLHFENTHRGFTQRKKDEGKSVSHIECVSSLSREFLHFLETRGITNIKTISQEAVDGYFEYLSHRKNKRRSGGLSSAYLEKHREAVLRFMEYVGGVDIGQSGYYIKKQSKDSIPKNVFTEAEIAILFEQCTGTIDGIRNKAILSILYGCGLRKGELHRLDVEDINLATSVIRVKKSKTFRQRDVPLSSRVLQYVEDYLFQARELLIAKASVKSAFLLNNRGERMALVGIQHKVKEMGRKSGIEKPLTPHGLRHAIATHLLGDFSIEEIATFLGHRSIDSSQIYTHIKYLQNPTA